MTRLLIHLSALSVLCLLASAALSETTTVKVLLQAPPNLPGCPLTVYQAEQEISTPFERLCSIKAEFKSLLRGDDQTGQALSDARARACLCGANAVLIVSNSSDSQPAGYVGSIQPQYGVPGSTSIHMSASRQQETVSLIALRVAAPAPTPAPPMPPNDMKAGFRDLAWGQTLTDAFVPLAGDDPKSVLRRFVRPDDELVLARIPVSHLRYLFTESKFCGAELSVQMTQWAQMKENLSALWGAPQRCEEGAPATCTWWANRAAGAAGTLATVSQNDGATTTLLIGNPELLKQAETRRRAAESGL